MDIGFDASMSCVGVKFVYPRSSLTCWTDPPYADGQPRPV